MERPLLIFFGHHKCASTWASSICAVVSREIGIRHGTVFQAKDIGYELNSHIRSESIEFLTFANADQNQVDKLTNFRGFHLIRDPRDVIVSAYFSHLKTHPTNSWPELIEYREKLQKVSMDEGLLLEMDFSQHYLQLMERWNYNQPNVLELRMEDATVSAYETFLNTFKFLGLLDESDLTPVKRIKYILAKASRKIEYLNNKKINIPIGINKIPAERLLGIVWEQQFSKMSNGRVQGQEDLTSHYRKGESGDWRNHFTDIHISLFKERYNDLLLKLGYEKNSNW